MTWHGTPRNLGKNSPLRQIGKSDVRRAQGYAAQRSGRSFEETVIASCDSYRATGKAVISRNSPPTVGWGKTMRYTGKATVDFSGWYEAGKISIPPFSFARPIAFDTKVVTGAASYSHATRDMHQIEYLLDFAQGGTVGLLLHDSALGFCWWLPGWRLPDVYAGFSTAIRTKNRDGTIVHHLPVLTHHRPTGASSASAPWWDFLPLVEQDENQVTPGAVKRRRA